MRAERTEVLTHGLVAGVLGYAIVVVFYAIWNALLGRSPFFTAALLGEAAFYGLKEPAELAVWAGPVLAFNGLHLLVFLMIGMVAAWIATHSERRPRSLYIGLALFIYGMIHVVGLGLWVAEPLRRQVPVWSTLVVTILALAGMSFYLLRVHPRLRQELRA